jgi:hypothetical protein
LKSLQRQEEFLDIQEEYIKDEMRNLKRELIRAREVSYNYCMKSMKSMNSTVTMNILYLGLPALLLLVTMQYPLRL